MDKPIFQIVEQGAPRINDASIVKEGEGFVAISIDFHSKYCEVIFHTSGSDVPPGIVIGANNNSLYLDKNQPSDKATEIVFPRWPTYHVFASCLAKYTLQVCLVEWPKI